MASQLAKSAVSDHDCVAGDVEREVDRDLFGLPVARRTVSWYGSANLSASSVRDRSRPDSVSELPLGDRYVSLSGSVRLLISEKLFRLNAMPSAPRTADSSSSASAASRGRRRGRGRWRRGRERQRVRRRSAGNDAGIASRGRRPPSRAHASRPDLGRVGRHRAGGVERGQAIGPVHPEAGLRGRRRAERGVGGPEVRARLEHRQEEVAARAVGVARRDAADRVQRDARRRCRSARSVACRCR